MINIVKIREDYWRVEAFDAKLGDIIKSGTGLFAAGPPEFTWRSTFTVAGEGRRVFGHKCNSLEEASQVAKDHCQALAHNILFGDFTAEKNTK